ncbi:methyltransferase domain-containing protein [Azospirillum brasilense]|uniref:class I SAM-dependent methyltransferase n=1 Tax=Azospirillum argentinense TaxID=2970906 RepID=UPI00190EDCB8|nr:class I SAM-dependent methyltransferase [Azospirillum argentinense]MBK3801220.1 methyltransferase domain-containing protein [Azospirillum argentinense]
MRQWSEGYNADIAYTNSFYRDLAPDYLSYVGLLSGVRTPDPGHPFRYCELGCGQGLTLTILAATHARSEFVGIDFNPAHIAAARRLADEAGLGNLSFREDSFQALARSLTEGRWTEEPFDFVVLHGVYSWVSEENRRAIVDVLDRLVKPGGLVYISHNTLAGWSPILPLQALMLEHAAAFPGRSDRQIGDMLVFLNRLKDAGAAYFQNNPVAAQHLAMMASQERRYLAHEYINDHWEPLPHARVARDLARAKLGYVGTATIPLNSDDLAFRPEIRAILAEIADPMLAQSVRELALNQPFRRDIYVRGPEPLETRAVLDEMAERRFTLIVPREEASLTFSIPMGELRSDPAVGEPILDALAAGTPTFAELLALPALAGQSPLAVSKILALLVAAHQAHPVTNQGEDSREGAAALNRALARRVLGQDEQRVLVAPAIGTAVVTDIPDRLAHAGLMAGLPADLEALARFAVDALRANGRQVFAEDGAPLATVEEMRARLHGILSGGLPRRLPLWRRLGAVQD